MTSRFRLIAFGPVAVAAFVLAVVALGAQDRLRTMPGYEQFTAMSKELQGGAFVSGAVTVRWETGGHSRTRRPARTTALTWRR